MTAPATPPPAISIVIDRVPLDPDQNAIDDRGSLLVPARAVFDALGAIIHYDAATGHIIAERGTSHISLYIGKAYATIGAHSFTLDAPPRVEDAHILVPLHFVTEAFGGVATFDRKRRVVAIDGASAVPSARDPQAIGTHEAYTGVTLIAERPSSGETVTSALPSISGEFQTHGGPAIDAQSVRYAIDGVDETPLVQHSGDHFGFTPSQPLAAGDHEIDVNGLDAGNTPFDLHWTFTVAENAAYAPAPGAEGATVESTSDAGTVDYTEDAGPDLTLGGPYGGANGDTVQVFYSGPAGGSGFVSLCGYSQSYPFVYDPVTNRYIAYATLPQNVYAPNCYVNGTFTTSNGTVQQIPMTSPIPIDTTSIPQTHDPRVLLPVEPRVGGGSPVLATPVSHGTPLSHGGPITLRTGNRPISSGPVAPAAHAPLAHPPAPPPLPAIAPQVRRAPARSGH